MPLVGIHLFAVFSMSPRRASSNRLYVAGTGLVGSEQQHAA